MVNMVKIREAEKATDIVVNGFHVAKLALGRCDTNGYGVLYDPSMVRADLRSAKDAIEKALKVHDATSWPTNSDYGE